MQGNGAQDMDDVRLVHLGEPEINLGQMTDIYFKTKTKNAPKNCTSRTYCTDGTFCTLFYDRYVDQDIKSCK